MTTILEEARQSILNIISQIEFFQECKFYLLHPEIDYLIYESAWHNSPELKQIEQSLIAAYKMEVSND